MRTRDFYPFLNPFYTMVRPSNAGNDRQSKKIRQSPDTPLYIYKNTGQAFRQAALHMVLKISC